MRIVPTIMSLFLSLLSVYGQTHDSIYKDIPLEEVVITSKAGTSKADSHRLISSIDEYLLASEKVNMIKRGGYAWEPVINSMTTERISTTIDGMKIFCACTDRMDPVTSYVETSNLSKASITSGLDGNPQAVNQIGGSINLCLKKAGFLNTGWNANLKSGFESNGNNLAEGGDFSYSGKTFYLNSGLSYHHSGNYKDGNGQVVNYSQYTKTNLFANLGYKLSDWNILEATAIYDIATNVGYPALTMDVKSAKGLICSLSYRHERMSGLFNMWETKVYYNDIHHEMDDTHRLYVVMHMDMPGWSRTGGVYSKLQGYKGRHSYLLNWDLYYNQSKADMTMYPSNSSSSTMYMLTWPDVRTLNSGVSLSDEMTFGKSGTLRISGKLSWQQNDIASDFGLRSLQVYYPVTNKIHDRFAGNMSTKYQYVKGVWSLSFGLGYGVRNPTVSEAYGYFLYNTFDGFDYLGNTSIKNESAFEINGSLGWKDDNLEVKLDANAFFFHDYIVGVADSSLTRMTIGAKGVKVYRNQSHALIFNSSVDINWNIFDNISLRNHIFYSIGNDEGNNPLPLIAPLSGKSTFLFHQYHYQAECDVDWTARHSRYGASYGESQKNGYAIAGLSVGYSFKVYGRIAELKLSAENLFNRYYSPYTNWNNIPAQGRNIIANAIVSL